MQRRLASIKIKNNNLSRFSNPYVLSKGSNERNNIFLEKQ